MEQYQVLITFDVIYTGRAYITTWTTTQLYLMLFQEYELEFAVPDGGVVPLQVNVCNNQTITYHMPASETFEEVTTFEDYDIVSQHLPHNIYYLLQVCYNFDNYINVLSVCLLDYLFIYVFLLCFNVKSYKDDTVIHTC